MRVLLDENLPHDLIAEFTGHEVLTVQGLGWAGVKNGELLRRASGQVDAFLTMDRKLEREHDLSALSFGVIVVHARSNLFRILFRSWPACSLRCSVSDRAKPSTLVPNTAQPTAPGAVMRRRG